MGKFSATKIFCLIVLILFAQASAMRITTGQEQEEGAVQPDEETTNEATDAEPAVPQNEGPSFYATPESYDFYRSGTGVLAQRLSEDALLYSRAVVRNIDDHCEFEVIDERLENDRPRDRADDEAHRLCDRFSFRELDIYIFEDAFFVLRSDDQEMTAHREAFEMLNPRYREINEMFHIGEDVSVAHFEGAYYLNDERRQIESRNLHFALTSETGYYQVEAMRIAIRTILVRVPRDLTFGPYVSYQGLAPLIDESGIDTPDTRNIDFTARLYTDIWGNTLGEDDFNVDEPEFDWHMSRTADPISFNLLLSYLDQENAVDRRISAQLGEDDDAPFDRPENVLAPKGLDSFNMLPIREANFTSRNGNRRYISVRPTVPDFAFLPLELPTTNNRATIIYVSARNVHVTMVGRTIIDEQPFRTEFVKENSASFYNITLYGIEGTSLTFGSIRSNIFSTMELGIRSTVLTTDPAALERLGNYGITETDTVIENPVIEISYDTYLMYVVSGRYSPDERLVNRINVSAQFVNLDGAVFSYVRFFFNPAVSAQRFFDFFSIDEGDSGFGSLRLDDFQLISSNRDFNSDQITQLRHSNIYVYQNQEVIAQNGLTLNLEANLLTDCNEFSFCRQLRAIDFPSAFTFSGLVRDDESLFVSDFADLRLNENVNFTSNHLRMRITHDADGIGYGHLHVRGRMNIDAEPDRMIAFRSIWSFGENPDSPIFLNANRYSIYDDVFGIPYIDFLESRIEGEIHLDNSIRDFTFTAMPVLGNDCYDHEGLVSQLQTNDDNAQYEVLNFDSTETDQEGHLNVLNDNCAVGSASLDIFTDEPNRNTFRANFYFDDFDQFARTVFNVRSDDQMIPLIRMISFPDGLNTHNTYDFAQDEGDHEREVDFYGRMDFLGIHSYGDASVSMNNQLMHANLILPSFSIGGGNLQFIDTNTIIRRYHIDEHSFNHGRLDNHLSRDEFNLNNTLSFDVDPANVAGSDLTLSANAIIFEILQRVEVVLEEERWNFRFNGKPFRGAFDADIIVEVAPVPNLARERDSIVRVVLDRIDNFHELEAMVNQELKNWVSNIIIAHRSIQDRAAEWQERRQYLVRRLEEIQDCPMEEQCLDVPTITCAEFAQEAVCVRQQEVCDHVIQRCTETETHENSWGTYTTCLSYETVCDAGQTSIVCLDYELQNIPDRCITMELSCTRVSVEDLSCTENQEQLRADIANIDRRLGFVRELLDLLSDLTQSSICVIRVEDEEDRQLYERCDQKDVTIEGYPEEIDVLDIFTLRDSRAIMALRNVVSSDSMIFQSDISLYGDWRRAEGERDRLVVANNVAEERQNREQGYDLDTESLLYINHYLDFNSVNHTTYSLSESVKQVVCLENNVGPEESARIQVLMRELAIIDGNSTFCPGLEVIDNSRFVNADTTGNAQSNVYATYDPNERYVSNALRTSANAELRFRYYEDQLEVPVSDIREEYGFERVPTDGQPQDITNRLDDQTIEEGLEVERTREQREEVLASNQRTINAELQRQSVATRRDRERQERLDEQRAVDEVTYAEDIQRIRQNAAMLMDDANEALQVAEQRVQEQQEVRAVAERMAEEAEERAATDEANARTAEEANGGEETPEGEEAPEGEEVISQEEAQAAIAEAEVARNDAAEARTEAAEARRQAGDAQELAEEAQREVASAQAEIEEAQEELDDSQDALTELIAEEEAEVAAEEAPEEPVDDGEEAAPEPGYIDEEAIDDLSDDGDNEVTEEEARLQSYIQLNLGSQLG